MSNLKHVNIEIDNYLLPIATVIVLDIRNNHHNDDNIQAIDQLIEGARLEAVRTSFRKRTKVTEFKKSISSRRRSSSNPVLPAAKAASISNKETKRSSKTTDNLPNPRLPTSVYGDPLILPTRKAPSIQPYHSMSSAPTDPHVVKFLDNLNSMKNALGSSNNSNNSSNSIDSDSNNNSDNDNNSGNNSTDSDNNTNDKNKNKEKKNHNDDNVNNNGINNNDDNNDNNHNNNNNSKNANNNSTTEVYPSVVPRSPKNTKLSFRGNRSRQPSTNSANFNPMLPSSRPGSYKKSPDSLSCSSSVSQNKNDPVVDIPNTTTNITTPATTKVDLDYNNKSPSGFSSPPSSPTFARGASYGIRGSRSESNLKSLSNTEVNISVFGNNKEDSSNFPNKSMNKKQKYRNQKANTLRRQKSMPTGPNLKSSLPPPKPLEISANFDELPDNLKDEASWYADNRMSVYGELSTLDEKPLPPSSSLTRFLSKKF